MLYVCNRDIQDVYRMIQNICLDNKLYNMLIKITRHLELVIQLEGMQCCCFSAENLIKLTQFKNAPPKPTSKFETLQNM